MSPVGAESVTAAFRERTGQEPRGVWAAPGRLNLIGEHTDYNGGFVLPMALAQRVLVAAGPANTGRTTVSSQQQPGSPRTFSASTVLPGEVDGWAAYVAGVFWALRTAGHDVHDLDLVLDGDVPLGAGLSSSAALECAVGITLRDLGGLDIDDTTLARLAQRAENDFVGAPTGVMDQMASMCGRDGSLVFLDSRSLEHQTVPLPLAEHGLALLVIDTRAPHEHVDSGYADRRASCEAAALALDVSSLREISTGDLDASLARLADARARRRVRHVVTENDRVLGVVARLRAGGDPRTIGPLLTASHVSLRDDFEVSVPALDLAVDTALDAGAHGARMTGGGFGGAILALVDGGTVSAVAAAVSDAFAGAGFAPPATFVAHPSDGAHRLS